MVPKRFSMGRGSSLMSKAVIASSAAAALLLAIPSAHAALVLYEPYNYGLAQGATMTGVQTNALGLANSYIDVDRNNSLASTNDVTYNTSSLSLPGVSEEGGSITDNPNGGKPIFATSVASSLENGLAGGNVYGSFLLSVSANNLGTTGSGLVSGLLFGTTSFTNNAISGITADNSSPINISPISWGQNYGQIRVGTVGAAGTGVQLVANTPYLELFQISLELGTGGVTAYSWTLSASQYANFQGDLTATALNAAGTGTAANQVTEEASASGTDSGLVSSLTSINNMSMMSFGTTSTYDEVRMSNTSLAEAAPVPEPASLGLFAVGGLGLLLLKRRKTA